MQYIRPIHMTEDKIMELRDLHNDVRSKVYPPADEMNEIVRHLVFVNFFVCLHLSGVRVV